MHDAGIVHGDIKPSNVLVHDSDHAYLLDFGVARRTGYADPRTNELVGGTPAYSAPEAVKGPFSDRYALGCVVFELLTGERPFGGGDTRLLARRHADSPRPRVSDVVPELESFDEPVMRAMARNPAERFASGAEFARALERAERAVEAEPTTLVLPPTRRRDDTPTPVAVEQRTPVPREPARKEAPRRRRGPVVAAALALLAAAIGTGWLATHAGGDSGAERQRVADQQVVQRLISHYADALATRNEDLLARTVSAGVVRTGTDGHTSTCVVSTGSRAALTIWAAQLDEINSYTLTATKVRVDGTHAGATAQAAINGLKPVRTSFTARLEDGVWRLTAVHAPCQP